MSRATKRREDEPTFKVVFTVPEGRALERLLRGDPALPGDDVLLDKITRLVSAPVHQRRGT